MIASSINMLMNKLNSTTSKKLIKRHSGRKNNSIDSNKIRIKNIWAVIICVIVAVITRIRRNLIAK